MGAHVIAQERLEIIPEAPSPRQHAFDGTPAQHGRLIRKETADRWTEMVFQGVIVTVVDQVEKTRRGGRVEQVCRRRRPRFAVVHTIMDASYRALRPRVHVDPCVRLGNNLLVVSKRRIRPPLLARTALETARRVPGIGGRYLPRARTGRIHAFVVKHNDHAAPSRVFDADAHIMQPHARHEPDGLRQSDARMRHKPVDSVSSELVDLTPQFVLAQRIIKKPERNEREFARRIDEGLEQCHRISPVPGSPWTARKMPALRPHPCCT